MVDLYSMLHIGEPYYYRNLEERLKDYDVVLYELITSEGNTEYEGGAKHRRTLRTDLVALEAEKLANDFDFTTQLCMDFKQPNWYIADLSSETVGRLEASRKGTTMAIYVRSLVAGRASQERLTIKNFFVSDSPFVTGMRLMSWLTPCPELGLLALDWSRFARAGGLPEVLWPILESIINGDLLSARKLAFTQQVLSGLPDAGAWGGEARSDTTVRVRARNRKCLDTLQCFLDELSTSNSSKSSDPGKPERIAILYGAYHIAQLSNSLSDLGLVKVVPSGGALDKITAWTVDTPRAGSPISVNQEGTASPASSSLSPSHVQSLMSTRSIFALLVVVPLYLAAGAFDWWAVVKLITDELSTLSKDGMQGGNAYADLAFGTAYFVFYVQRHISILRTFSQYGIRWEAPLFEDALDTSES